MSEWLGTGLQNRLHQFESGWNLEARVLSKEDPLYFTHCQHFTYLRHGDSLQKNRAQNRPRLSIWMPGLWITGQILMQ